MSVFSCQLDATGFYINGHKKNFSLACDIDTYDPKLHDAVMIPVDVNAQASLMFDDEIAQIESIKALEGRAILKLEIDLTNAALFEGMFNINFHALKVLTEKILKPYQEMILGCCLFQGECDLSHLIQWNAAHVSHFIEWLTDTYKTPDRLFEAPEGARPLGDLESFQDLSIEMFDVTPFCRHLKNLYLMNVISGYLHRLAAALPEELFVFVAFDARQSLHPAYLYQLFSKERFAYLHLAVKGALIPLEALTWKESTIEASAQEVKIGVCFPNDPYCFQSTLHQLKKLFQQLHERKIPYRIIPEYLLTSSWEGIDDLIFACRSLSPQGKRILQGFAITGGRLVYMDHPVGLSGEMEYSDWISSI